MKGSEFINLLRKIIREEVRTVVKEELKSVKTLLESNTPQQKAAKIAQPKRTNPIVSIDGALGDILRETAESMHKSPIADDEWPDAFGGTMTSDSLGGFSEEPVRKPNMSVGMNVGVDISDAPFLKDYSKVLKSAEMHAQGHRL